MRQVSVRDEPGDARQHGDAREERRPRAEHQQEPAERRPDHHAHVRGDADGGERSLAALRRDEVRDHRLRHGTAERAEHAGERERSQPRPLRVREREQQQWIADHDPVADQDHTAPADPVGEIAARKAAEPGEHGSDEERERQRRLRAELLDGPDRQEAPRRGPRRRADERHAEDGPQRVVEVVIDGKARKARLLEVLERGADFERLAYEAVSA